MTGGTNAGSKCSAPVNLLSLYPTVTDLVGVPRQQGNSSPSLLPLLKDPGSDWDEVSLTFLGRPGNYSVSGHRYRYIAYDNGDEELYDIARDPHEWRNLAADAKFAGKIAELKRRVPARFAEYENTSAADLPKLKWRTSRDSSSSSNPKNKGFNVLFSNQAGEPLKLFYINNGGDRQSYGTLETGWSKPLRTHSGAVWMIANAAGTPLGHFVVGSQPAHAVIPATTP